jgi:hypothetical protein
MREEKVGQSSNVVSLKFQKQKREFKKRNQTFREYLELLSNDELEIEINSLFSGLDAAPFDREKLIKGKLILEAIAQRIDNSPMKAESIKAMKQVIREKLDVFEIASN